MVAVRSGEIAEENIEVSTDNDSTTVYDNGNPDDYDELEGGDCIFSGNGWADQNDLWQALLPKAKVKSV